MTKRQYHFYGKNTYFLDSPVNKKFEEVLSMNDTEFRQWIIDVRKTIVDIWDNKGVPPLNGYTREEITEQFGQLESFNVLPMFIKDELTGDTCIRNTHNKLGNACNSWFPTMMKTKIDYGNGKARSIYDFMAEDSLLEKYMPYGYRHFKRDSFYAYSRCITVDDRLPNKKDVIIRDACDWIEKYNKLIDHSKFGFWLQEAKKDKNYTGYNENLINKEFLALTKDQVEDCIKRGLVHQEHMYNVGTLLDDKKYIIRVYEKGQKIFPVGLKSFRVSVCQSAVNFPPVIAKAVWERYTDEFKTDDKVYVWDPSSGWGGRILGAMACKRGRNIVYLGNDPNTDHTIYSGGVSVEGQYNPPNCTLYTKYDDLATFYNKESSRTRGTLEPHENEWKFWQLGSEVMQFDTEFQKYKGKLSVVFTSPPYFHREVYSQDAEQSCHKFSAYEDWRDKFLYETLKTAYEWLRPGGYIVWNIASIKEGNKFVPLQEDSESIMLKLGFEKVEVLQMVMAQMPGSNRVVEDEDGELVSTNKNAVRIDGKFFRSEPMFVYRKV